MLKQIPLSVGLLMTVLSLHAQETELIGSDSVVARPAGNYEKGIYRYLPDHLNLQFAGGIGFISGGFGYETKNHRLKGDFFYGYVPESVGGVTIHSVTAKLTWAAFTRQLYPDFRVDWLTTGVLVNHVFGKQYFGFDPEFYPYSYYGFPTDTHVSIFVGQAAYYRKFGIYYEADVTDRDILSYVKNTKSVEFLELFNVAIGFHYSIFGHDWQRKTTHKKAARVAGSL